MTYRLSLTETATEEISRLPARDATVVLNFINEQLSRKPEVLGTSLTGALRGLLAIKHKQYTIIYDVDDSARVVNVLRVG
ncbi:hypothetical protein GCM10011609_67840 [Lentzea pudingi]|jgi:mRNA-degrading endonuclease RelE of RelBE toxin-antitoxin system|uniref:mRNA interferase RelE/StbE n=1 Tax=Lentzea pudingi TaxID=1789439 RepID=A0ABQ2IQ30_9PSEU|nr:type II toxin-antitoxin system RelE/ParE family toxin [Lentzea pudingi]GGN17415.1 hypothetical protein GCM10011609_67840 [Lentzea pudingi]